MYNLNQFSDNGVSWPFSINDLTGKNLEKEYFTFQNKAQSIMKKNITLNQIYYQNFLIIYVLRKKYYIMSKN